MNNLTPREVQEAVEAFTDSTVELCAGKHLPNSAYTALFHFVGDIDYVWAYCIDSSVAIHRSHNKAALQSVYDRCNGSEGELARFAEELGVDFGGADELPVPDPAHRIQEELTLLRKQNGELHAKLKRLRAKMKHHLAERDRYRDLYNEAAKKLQAASARHPNF